MKLTSMFFLVVACLCFAMLERALASQQGAGEPERMSLEQSIEFALNNSPLLKATSHEWNASKAFASQARSRQGFRLDSRHAYTRQGPVVSFGGGPVVPDFREDTNFILTRPIWSPGLTASRKIAEVSADISGDQYYGTAQEVVFLTTAAYIDVLRAEALMEVAQKSLEANQERLRVAESMFKAGNSPKFDVLRAEVQLAAAQQLISASQNRLEVARAAFNNELGRPTHAPVALQPLPREELPKPNLEENTEAAIASRPELAAAQKQISLAFQRERLARADGQPAVSFSSSYNRQTETRFSRDYRYDAIAIFSLPLFDSGVARHGVKQAREEQSAARMLAEQTRQRVELEVRRAVLNIDDARTRIGVAGKAVAQAEEALRIANLRYQTRIAPIIEVLDAEAALTQARNNEVNAWFDYSLAHAQLLRAVGSAKVPTANNGKPKEARSVRRPSESDRN